MKPNFLYSLSIVAVRFALVLAVIFIYGCNVATSPTGQPVAVVTDTSTPTATRMPPAGATATALPLPANTDTATETTTPTPTLTTTPQATNVPTSEPTRNESQPIPGVYETTLTIPTYPITDFLIEQVDPLYNIPVYYFNRPAYEAANPDLAPVEYSAVVLENPYLRLTFLPELGGRLYSALIKATNQELFYHNKVVKPSRFGVLQPPEANWWLATGGMEFAYPTQEHGYRFGRPWSYEVTEGSTTNSITLSDTGPDRIGAVVTVTLLHNSAAFSVESTIENNGADAAPVQLWNNAALTLGADTMSILTQFVVPTEVITVHSRGAVGWEVPDAKQSAPWPFVGSTDLRDYSQWSDYLGFFVANKTVPFIGAYNPDTNMGVVRVVKTSTSQGSGKVFAFGAKYPYTDYTDDGSQYFELWGGANASFWPEDDILLAVGQSTGWQEIWWPLAQLNGLTWANQDMAIAVNPATDNGYTLSALSAHPLEGQVQVLVNNVPILAEPFSADPARPLTWKLDHIELPANIIFFDDDGVELLTYQLQ